MNKRSVLELTALLDIFLILLFAFMMNSSSDVQSLAEEKQALLQEMEQLAREKQTLQDEITNLESELTETVFVQDKAKQTLTTLVDSFAAFLQVNQQELTSLIQKAEVKDRQQLQDTLNLFIDEQSIVKELWKHELLVKKFYFIEVGLKSSSNQVYINGEPTQITILYDELADRDKKKEEIKEAIEQVIQDREGGIGMVALSLTMMDEEIYQYAYQLTWDAIKDVQEKYGMEKIFISEYTLFE